MKKTIKSIALYVVVFLLALLGNAIYYNAIRHVEQTYTGINFVYITQFVTYMVVVFVVLCRTVDCIVCPTIPLIAVCAASFLFSIGVLVLIYKCFLPQSYLIHQLVMILAAADFFNLTASLYFFFKKRLRRENTN